MKFVVGMVTGAAIAGLFPSLVASQTFPETLPAVRIVVNSPLDGPIQPDGALTLREAIAIANGTLALDDLSVPEQAQIEPLAAGEASTIVFNLPPEETTIYLTAVLPDLAAPGLVVDGTTQPGYGTTRPGLPEIPVPVVSLTPAPGREVFRGFTVSGPGVTVRGFSLYGFWARDRATKTTPPADIFIASAPPPADSSPDAPPIEFFNLEDPAIAPQQVVIEQNWLGVKPDGTAPAQRSAFGVSIFNSVGAQVRNNLIQNHEGSGVITGYRATDLALVGNAIIGNGVAGIPDAVRLEGDVTGATILNNLICANDGSGIFLFKPEGGTLIQGNDIRFNGRRFERAAVYVMGAGHQILANDIGYQPGPGVAVAAVAPSDRTLIRDNRFTQLQGLSIDLVTQNNASVQDFQRGDGPNPPRNSRQRRRDTANGAINAPSFDRYVFDLGGDTVRLVGKADPGSEVDLYQVVEDAGVYSPLAEPMMTVPTAADGTFEAVWDDPAGGWVSAIATDPEYGTSEPSPVIQILGTDGTSPDRPSPAPYLATCLADAEPETPAPPRAVTPDPIRLRIPRNIHFALDRSDISPESAAILDQIAAALLDYPSLTVELHGHTDPRASVAYNQALSERRAIAARDYLVRRGVAPERLRIVPLGESQRRSQGSSRLDFARDRRVEFIFTDTQGLNILFEDLETDLQLE